MNEKQPEALRLADELDAYHTAPRHKLAAIELRRLHELNQELMEALKDYVNSDDVDDELNPRKRQAKTALAKAGEKA